MSRPGFMTKTGTQIFVGDENTDPTEQLEGRKALGDMPGGEDIDEFETTRLDALTAESAIDWIKYHEPSHEDPGHLVPTFGYDEDLHVRLMELKREDKRFKVVFPSGAYLLFNGWIKGVKQQGNDDGEYELMVKIRVNGLPEFTPAS